MTSRRRSFIVRDGQHPDCIPGGMPHQGESKYEVDEIRNFKLIVGFEKPEIWLGRKHGRQDETEVSEIGQRSKDEEEEEMEIERYL